jgi:hypothetical protein
MLDVRANIVSNGSLALAKAATIALRYSMRRKQVRAVVLFFFSDRANIVVVGLGQGSRWWEKIRFFFVGAHCGDECRRVREWGLRLGGLFSRDKKGLSLQKMRALCGGATGSETPPPPPSRACIRCA